MSNEQSPASIISERHQPPTMTSAPAKRENFGWAAILACITTLLFIALVAMQWMDLSALKLA